MTKAFEKIRAGLDEALKHAQSEAEREAHETWAGLMETFGLPEGVHYLSHESMVILERAAARGSKLAARHIKRGS